MHLHVSTILKIYKDFLIFQVILSFANAVPDFSGLLFSNSRLYLIMHFMKTMLRKIKKIHTQVYEKEIIEHSHHRSIKGTL